MTKEEAYDSEIFPLMGKIIEVCKREKISMVANFQLSVKGEEDLRCTTALLDKDYQPSKEQLSAFDLLYHGFTAFAITTRKKS